MWYTHLSRILSIFIKIIFVVFKLNNVLIWKREQCARWTECIYTVSLSRYLQWLGLVQGWSWELVFPREWQLPSYLNHHLQPFCFFINEKLESGSWPVSWKQAPQCGTRPPNCLAEFLPYFSISGPVFPKYYTK